MGVYKFNKSLKSLIDPIPGDIVELDGTRLKVVEGGTTGYHALGCRKCFLKHPPCNADIDQMLLDRLCMRTKCDGLVREDSVDIHYEEVKDGQ